MEAILISFLGFFGDDKTDYYKKVGIKLGDKFKVRQLTTNSFISEDGKIFYKHQLEFV